jgi:hypothetical protein
MAPAVPYLDPLDAGERRRLSATRAELYRSIRSVFMPADAAYALLPQLEGAPKPCILPSLAALARRIHRLRGQDGLQLNPTQVRFRDRVRPVTEILAIEEASGRCRRLGFAWHAGRSIEALRAALDEAVPVAATDC